MWYKDIWKQLLMNNFTVKKDLIKHPDTLSVWFVTEAT